MKQEYWNASKEIIKLIYFDENNFSIEERNSLEQAITDLNRNVDREITLQTAKGLFIDRGYICNEKNDKVDPLSPIESDPTALSAKIMIH